MAPSTISRLRALASAPQHSAPRPDGGLTRVDADLTHWVYLVVARPHADGVAIRRARNRRLPVWNVVGVGGKGAKADCDGQRENASEHGSCSSLGGGGLHERVPLSGRAYCRGPSQRRQKVGTLSFNRGMSRIDRAR